MIVTRNKKSVVIPVDKLKQLRKAYKGFHTKVDAEEAIGVYYRVLDRLMYQNTCSPDTLAQIETYLSNNKKVA